MASNVTCLAERRPANLPRVKAQAAATLQRAQDELWAAFMAASQRVADTSCPVGRRNHCEAVAELLDALDAVHAAAQVARQAAIDAHADAREKEAASLLDAALDLRWRKLHLLKLGSDALLDGLALQKLRDEHLGEPWSLAGSLALMLGGPLDLDARAERLRRELGLTAP